MPIKTLSRFAAFLSLMIPGAAASNPSLPAPGVYKIDPNHTFAYFAAWHHIVGTVRGRFDKVTGTFTVSPDPGKCTVDVVIATYSVNTQNSDRDDDLRSPSFFDVVKFPTATYRGRGLRRVSNDSWVMDGSLDIRGFSTVVPLTLSYKGVFPDTPSGQPARVAFHATAGARRAAFGMTRDNLMELGPHPSPKPDVDIQIDVEADFEPK